MPDSATLRRSLRTAAAFVAFVAVPTAVVGWLLGLLLALSPEWDLSVYWTAGRNVLAGIDPYPPAEAHVLAGEHSFVYPAPTLALFVPLALLSFEVAAIVVTVLSFAAVGLALAALGVRDRRCYAAALFSPGVADAIGLGAFTPFLVLGVALLWRYRDRPAAAVPLAAALLVSKLFLWPLLVWLAVTRRTRTALGALALSLLASVAAWAAIGFDGFLAYPRILIVLADAVQEKSYSAVALGLALGLPEAAATAVAVAAGVAVLAAAIVLARRPDGGRSSLTAAIAASLLLTPIVWTHYFALLFVPIALSRQRLSLLWLLPLLMWISPEQSHGDPLKIGLCLGVALLVLGLCTARPSSRLPALATRRPARVESL